MSFLFPAFLIGGAAIAIPIVLHLLRRDIAPDVPFTAVHLLRGSPIERSHRRRLRDVVLLAARIVALLLLAAAFARPYRAGAAPPARILIVAVDRSFSMGAPGAFERGRQLARAAIDDAGSARVAVIAFDERAEVIAPPGGAAEARQALDRLAPGFGATRYAPLVERAAEIAEGDPGRLVVVTDLQRAGWEGEPHAVLPAGLELDVRDVGAGASNVAVLQVRPQGTSVIVTVRNSAAAPYAGTLRLTIDGKPIGSAAAALPPESTLDVPVRVRVPASGTLVASLDDEAGWPADNSRTLLLDAAPRSQVLVLVSSGSGVSGSSASSSGFYLARAFEATAPDEDGFEPTVVAGAAFSALDASALRRQAVVIVLSTRSLDRRARDLLATFVREGGGLWVSAGPEVDASLLTGLLGSQPLQSSSLSDSRPRVLAATDVRHPIFRPFGPLTANLGQVRFDRAWRMPTDGWTVVASFTDGAPALLERADGAGRVLLFTSDLDRRWNDFPLHPAFVPFVLESVRYAAGVRPASRDRLVGEAPAGVPQVPGVYPLADGRRLVLNVDTRESSSSRISVREFTDMLQRVDPGPRRAENLRAQLTEARQSYWQYGLVLMLVVLVGESVIGRAS